MNEEEKIFKDNSERITFKIEKDLAENLEKFKDPIVLGEIVYLLKEERENTNRILKNILAKLEAIENNLKSKREDVENILLGEIDKNIVEILKEGPKTAEDIRAKLGYKGKNAASARLNRLYELGIVNKKQAGKKVYFMLK